MKIQFTLLLIITPLLSLSLLPAVLGQPSYVLASLSTTQCPWVVAASSLEKNTIMANLYIDKK